MPDDDRTATLSDIAELRGEIGMLRTDTNRGIAGIAGRLDALADGFVSHSFLAAQIEAQDAARLAAVEASKDDRDKLWAAVHSADECANEAHKRIDTVVWATAAGALGLLTSIALVVIAYIVNT